MSGSSPLAVSELALYVNVRVKPNRDTSGFSGVSHERESLLLAFTSLTVGLIVLKKSFQTTLETDESNKFVIHNGPALFICF